jgi:HEAT repeat protein
MGKSRGITFWARASLLVLPLALLVFFMFMREPTYHSKPASYWFTRELKPLEASAGMDALQALGKKAVPTLEGALKSKTPNDRYKAVWALGQLGSTASDSIPAIIGVLNDGNNSVRYYAIDSLSRIDPSREEIIPPLIERLADSNNSVCASAAELLERIEEERKANNLQPFYRDEFQYAMAYIRAVSPNVQLRGVHRLGAIQERDAEVLPVLNGLLENSNQSVRVYAELYLKQHTPQ